jgi:hypothetical protein
MTDPSKIPDKPVLTPISRLFLMIAGAMFGLFLLKYFGVASS